ncbi:hypothetical protein DIPPA_27960 [Diplonema papillatum]|nr:hypothetical protein DIPPA_27960 [Diplonema papillatum]
MSAGKVSRNFALLRIRLFERLGIEIGEAETNVLLDHVQGLGAGLFTGSAFDLPDSPVAEQVLSVNVGSDEPYALARPANVNPSIAVDQIFDDFFCELTERLDGKTGPVKKPPREAIVDFFELERIASLADAKAVMKEQAVTISSLRAKLLSLSQTARERLTLFLKELCILKEQLYRSYRDKTYVGRPTDMVEVFLDDADGNPLSTTLDDLLAYRSTVLASQCNKSQAEKMLEEAHERLAKGHEVLEKRTKRLVELEDLQLRHKDETAALQAQLERFRDQLHAAEVEALELKQECEGEKVKSSIERRERAFQDTLVGQLKSDADARKRARKERRTERKRLAREQTADRELDELALLLEDSSTDSDWSTEEDEPAGPPAAPPPPEGDQPAAPASKPAKPRRRGKPVRARPAAADKATSVTGAPPPPDPTVVSDKPALLPDPSSVAASGKPESTRQPCPRCNRRASSAVSGRGVGVEVADAGPGAVCEVGVQTTTTRATISAMVRKRPEDVLGVRVIREMREHRQQWRSRAALKAAQKLRARLQKQAGGPPEPPAAAADDDNPAAQPSPGTDESGELEASSAGATGSRAQAEPAAGGGGNPTADDDNPAAQPSPGTDESGELEASSAGATGSRAQAEPAAGGGGNPTAVDPPAVDESGGAELQASSAGATGFRVQAAGGGESPTDGVPAQASARAGECDGAGHRASSVTTGLRAQAAQDTASQPEGGGALQASLSRPAAHRSASDLRTPQLHDGPIAPFNKQAATPSAELSQQGHHAAATDDVGVAPDVLGTKQPPAMMHTATEPSSALHESGAQPDPEGGTETSTGEESKVLTHLHRARSASSAPVTSDLAGGSFVGDPLTTIRQRRKTMPCLAVDVAGEMDGRGLINAEQADRAHHRKQDTENAQKQQRGWKPSPAMPCPAAAVAGEADHVEQHRKQNLLEDQVQHRRKTAPAMPAAATVAGEAIHAEDQGEGEHRKQKLLGDEGHHRRKTAPAPAVPRLVAAVVGETIHAEQAGESGKWRQKMEAAQEEASLRAKQIEELLSLNDELNETLQTREEEVSGLTVWLTKAEILKENLDDARDAVEDLSKENAELEERVFSLERSNAKLIEASVSNTGQLSVKLAESLTQVQLLFRKNEALEAAFVHHKRKIRSLKVTEGLEQYKTSVREKERSHFERELALHKEFADTESKRLQATLRRVDTDHRQLKEHTSMLLHDKNGRLRDALDRLCEKEANLAEQVKSHARLLEDLSIIRGELRHVLTENADLREAADAAAALGEGDLGNDYDVGFGSRRASRLVAAHAESPKKRRGDSVVPFPDSPPDNSSSASEPEFEEPRALAVVESEQPPPGLPAEPAVQMQTDPASPKKGAAGSVPGDAGGKRRSSSQQRVLTFPTFPAHPAAKPQSPPPAAAAAAGTAAAAAAAAVQAPAAPRPAKPAVDLPPAPNSNSDAPRAKPPPLPAETAAAAAAADPASSFLPAKQQRKPVARCRTKRDDADAAKQAAKPAPALTSLVLPKELPLDSDKAQVVCGAFLLNKQFLQFNRALEQYMREASLLDASIQGAQRTLTGSTAGRGRKYSQDIMNDVIKQNAILSAQAETDIRTQQCVQVLTLASLKKMSLFYEVESQTASLLCFVRHVVAGIKTTTLHLSDVLTRELPHAIVGDRHIVPAATVPRSGVANEVVAAFPGTPLGSLTELADMLEVLKASLDDEIATGGGKRAAAGGLRRAEKPVHKFNVVSLVQSAQPGQAGDEELFQRSIGEGTCLEAVGLNGKAAPPAARAAGPRRLSGRTAAGKPACLQQPACSDLPPLAVVPFASEADARRPSTQQGFRQPPQVFPFSSVRLRRTADDPVAPLTDTEPTEVLPQASRRAGVPRAGRKLKLFV